MLQLAKRASQPTTNKQPDVKVQACNSSIWEAEAGVQGHLNYTASLRPAWGYLSSYLGKEGGKKSVEKVHL